MNKFFDYLAKLESLKKEKKFDEAWKIANKGVVELYKQNDDSWFMMYYQMADILARQKRWFEALIHMGLVIHYLKRIGGVGHEKFVHRLLKKFNAEDKYQEYIQLVIESSSEEIQRKLKILLKV